MTQIEEVVYTLNEAYLADPRAIKRLIGRREQCNELLADHPTVQVGEIDGGFDVSPLGLINAVVETLTGKRVAAKYNEEHKLLGFMEYQP